ncbi:beta-glucosidase BglX [Pseudomonas gingeri]|uniref:beta-glucosidase n=2 Tax=Pseudomonas gingeri TaxID=117681 RepID=A0A7Y7XDY8_9PSED|nr:beta-glucosidase BglX [Pseudomonas gingeri]
MRRFPPIIATLVALIAIGILMPRDVRSTEGKSGRIETLLGQMTLEEKAGQLNQIGLDEAYGENSDDDSIRQGQAGSLLGVVGAATTLRLQHLAVEESRLHIPLLFSFDVIHGYRTIFPVPLAEASAWAPELAQRTARAAAMEATAGGVHWTYAPMVDIARDPRWGRVVEGAGEDPFLGSALAVARVRGFHGGGRGDPSSLLTTAKHFVAYGAAEAGRDYNIADLSERTLNEVYLPPFRAAVEAGVDAIMPGFNEIAGTPMHANPVLINERLRRQWGFKGVVVSDFTAVSQLMTHGVAATPSAAARLAMEATVDIDMVSNLYQQELPALVRAGVIPQQRLDDAVRRVLEAKEKLGLFDAPYRYSDPAREQARLLMPQTRALAREAAQKSIVLLKNDKALLPLRKDLHALLVVGALADDALSTLGPWHAEGRPEESVSVLAGIKQAVSPNTAVTYISAASPLDHPPAEIDKVVQAAAKADAIIAVLGETADMSGEATSRTTLGLPGAQNALLARLIKTGKPLVLVLMNGRPLALPSMSEQVPAILESWFLGSEMGNGVADIIFGDINPSGKLPITFPRAVGQVPIYYAHKNTGRPPENDEHDTSKYLDQPWTPRYPFGYGLSYTTFTYGPPILSATRLPAQGVLNVQVEVSNSGPREGEEIVQLYLRQNVASVTRPVRLLRGFTRVKLAPGQTRTVTFQLDQDDFALLDRYFLRVIEPGTFSVFVGGSSDTENQASFEITSGARIPNLGSAIPLMLRTPAQQ